MKYTIKWTALEDTDYTHTAATKYVADGFVLWKGRRRVLSCIYSADEWHLIRTADGNELHYAKTAKECMGALEYCLRKGEDIYSIDGCHVSCGIKFNDDFSDYTFIETRAERRKRLRKGR